MTRTYSQMHRTDKYSEHWLIIWPVWANGWVFVYELSGSGFKSSCSHLIMIPTCFQECSIYWMKSVNWRHLLEPYFFSIIVLLFHGTTWSHPYVKNTVSTSQHFLRSSILLPAVRGWFEKNWMICLFEGSHCSPALLKVPIYSIELVAVIFVWKVLC